jgi:hypothetical protein
LPLTLDEDLKPRPRVRLVRVALPMCEELILVSNLMDRSAQYLMESYRQRWKPERYHSLLEGNAGSAAFLQLPTEWIGIPGAGGRVVVCVIAVGQRCR